jgi:DNA ligase-1
MFKAMLAPNEEMVDLSVIKFPKLMSPKLDGIRAMVQGGKLVSRNQKLIPNLYLQSMFGHKLFEGLDGELILGSPTADDVFRVTSSAVMSDDGEPDVTYNVFDKFGPEGFAERLKNATRVIDQYGISMSMVLVKHQTVLTLEELLRVEACFIAEGFEGGMLRDPNGRYKQGRATVKENILLKLKRFKHNEAIITGFEEELENTNEKSLTSNGKAKRSHHKAGMVPKGTLGSFLATDVVTGVEFSVASGTLTDPEKQEIWNHRDKYLHKILRYKHFPKGVKTKPRFPTFEGLRDPRDM